MDRRKFIKSSAAAAAAVSMGSVSSMASVKAEKPQLKSSRKIKFQPQTFQAPDGEIRSLLLHLGHNMWHDWPTEQMGENLEEAILKLPEKVRPDLVLACQDEVWRTITDHAAARGINMIVIDLGEGVVLPSHPELAVEGSWNVQKIQKEIARLNGMGIECIPKFNFGSPHAGWLKDYRHMISSKPFYRMVEEVLADAYEIFGHPRFMHVGYDEEKLSFRSGFSYCVQRLGESWWCDFLHVVRVVENLGARPMAWSDFGWDDPEYVNRCPKSVVQQNWFYGNPATQLRERPGNPILPLFKQLDEAGFDQIPCGSNCLSDAEIAEGKVNRNMPELIEYCNGVISAGHLMGYMMAPWGGRIIKQNQDLYIQGIDIFAETYGK